jgi:hypothetical protein
METPIFSVEAPNKRIYYSLYMIINTILPNVSKGFHVAPLDFKHCDY